MPLPPCCSFAACSATAAFPRLSVTPSVPGLHSSHPTRSRTCPGAVSRAPGARPSLRSSACGPFSPRPFSRFSPHRVLRVVRAAEPLRRANCGVFCAYEANDVPTAATPDHLAKARRIVVSAFMASTSCIGVLLGASIPAFVWPARLLLSCLSALPCVYIVLAHGLRRGILCAGISTVLLFLSSGVQTPILFACVTAPVALALGFCWRADVPAIITYPFCAALRAAGSLLSLRLASILLGEDLLGVAVAATRAVLRAALLDHVDARAVVLGTVVFLSSTKTLGIALVSRIVARSLASYDLPPPDAPGAAPELPGPRASASLPPAPAPACGGPAWPYPDAEVATCSQCSSSVRSMEAA
eukprot:tig00000882_g5272.t1